MKRKRKSEKEEKEGGKKQVQNFSRDPLPGIFVFRMRKNSRFESSFPGSKLIERK